MKVRRNDWLLIAGFAALALVLFGWNALKPREAAARAELRVDGALVCSLPLSEDASYRWEAGRDFVEVRVEGGRARVAASSCKDQLCVKQGEIGQSGQSVICLPNRAALTLVADSEGFDGGGLDAVVR